MAVITFPITLKDSFMISPMVKHFVFNSPNNQPFKFIAGQFITIHFEKEGKLLRRSYSIANSPSHADTIEFAAGYVDEGPGTELLFNLEPGQQININGPFGRLILKDEPCERYLLIATSTGVTPYRSMLESLTDLLAENPALRIVVLQGVQHKADLLYGDEFAKMAKNHPQFEFRAQFSRESGLDLDKHEYQGYVQSAFDGLNLNPEKDIVYLCGNPAMIDESFEILKEKQFSISNIRREKYISR